MLAKVFPVATNEPWLGFQMGTFGGFFLSRIPTHPAISYPIFGTLDVTLRPAFLFTEYTNLRRTIWGVWIRWIRHHVTHCTKSIRFKFMRQTRRTDAIVVPPKNIEVILKTNKSSSWISLTWNTWRKRSFVSSRFHIGSALCTLLYN